MISIEVVQLCIFTCSPFSTILLTRLVTCIIDLSHCDGWNHIVVSFEIFWWTKKLNIFKYVYLLIDWLIYLFIHYTSQSLALFLISPPTVPSLIPLSFFLWENGMEALQGYTPTLSHQVFAGQGTSSPTKTRQSSPGKRNYFKGRQQL